MKQRRFSLLNVLFGLSLLSVLACFGGEGSDLGLPDPTIRGTEPCRAVAGENIEIHGFNLNHTGTVSIGGVQAQVVSWSNDKIVATIPAGAANGNIVVDPDLYGIVSTTFTIGSRSTVAEVEPNDAIDCSNATPDGGNRAAGGALSNALDKDHFKFECLVRAEIYKLKMTPRLVGQVFVNGVAKNLDANGEVRLVTNSDMLCVGITGAAGAYNLTMTLEPR